MFSQKLVDHLVGLEGRPWADCGRNGKALTQNGLARMLSKFEIKSSGTIRIDDKTGKGYELTAFKDAFERYLPPPPISSVTPSQKPEYQAKSGPYWGKATVTNGEDVTVANSRKPFENNERYGVTDENPLSGECAHVTDENGADEPSSDPWDGDADDFGSLL